MDSEETVSVDEAMLYVKKKYNLVEYAYGLNRLDLVILKYYLGGVPYKDKI